MPRAVHHSAMADLPSEVVADGLLQRAGVRMDGALVVCNWLEPGFDAGAHHEHAFDQLALVFGGVLELDVDGVRYAVGDEQVLYIPAGIPHTARVLGQQRVLNIDVFAPAREDYAHLTEAQPS